MFPFSKSVDPAIRSHLDTQVAFFNDLSKSVSNSFQQAVQANLQLGQSMIEQTMLAGQKMLTADNSTDAFSSAVSRAQPAAETLRAYQQHVSRLTADAQADISRVAQQHIPETSRTAQALAQEVNRVATEETDRSIKQQEEALKNFRDPFGQNAQNRGNGSSQVYAGSRSDSDRAGASMQADSQRQSATDAGNAQGRPQPAQATQQPGSRTPGKSS